MSISTLFFDLDGTIYPADNGIWDRVSDLMNAYIHKRLDLPMHQVPALRNKYFQEYGTTLKGLLTNHSVDPHEYLDFVHDIDYPAYLKPDGALDAMLSTMPQRKWVLTNASREHAEQVLKHLQVADHFDGIIDVVDMQFDNKPHPSAYHLALQRAGDPAPQDCLFIDDVPHNLDAAREIGLATVLVTARTEIDTPHLIIPDIYALPRALQALENVGADPL